MCAFISFVCHFFSLDRKKPIVLKFQSTVFSKFWRYRKIAIFPRYSSRYRGQHYIYSIENHLPFLSIWNLYITMKMLYRIFYFCDPYRDDIYHKINYIHGIYYKFIPTIYNRHTCAIVASIRSPGLMFRVRKSQNVKVPRELCHIKKWQKSEEKREEKRIERQRVFVYMRVYEWNMGDAFGAVHHRVSSKYWFERHICLLALVLRAPRAHSTSTSTPRTISDFSTWNCDDVSA